MLASKSPPRSRALTWDSSLSDLLPTEFGPYRVLHQLGAGVLGPVFRAVTNGEPDGPAAAVKVFVFDLTPEQAAACAERLQHLAGGRLAHPSLVRLISAGTEGSLPFLAQEYVSGDSVDAVLRERGPFPLDDVVELSRQLAIAIDAARVAGVLHGRLHPRDIIVRGPGVWITGHGVGPALEECGVTVPLRRPYAAPERLAGEAWGVSADVYALGAMTYELITGRRIGATGDLSFSGATAPQLNPRLHDVLGNAMAASPSARYQSATEFADALTAAACPQAAVAVRMPEEVNLMDLSEGFTFDPELGHRTMTLEGPPLHDSETPPGESETVSERRRSFSLRGALALVAIGIAVGIAFGYGLAIRTAQLSRVGPVSGAHATGGSAPGPVEGSAGPARAWTGSTVAEPPAPRPAMSSPAVPIVPEAAPAARRKPRKVAPASVAPSAVWSPVSSLPDRSGTLAVRTRPEGARVFLNGRLVGITPLVLTGIAAGSHTLGLELSGYRRWSASVRVGPGKRHDVTASLDRVQDQR